MLYWSQFSVNRESCILNFKEISDYLLKVYFKKVTEISSKTAKKVSTVPKTVHFKKNRRYR